VLVNQPDAPASKPREGFATQDAGHVPISEELDRAKWTLPPILPVAAAALIVAAVIAAYTLHAAHPLAQGRILGVYAVEQADHQHVLAEVQLEVTNLTSKPLWVRQVTVQLKPVGDAPGKPPQEDRGAPAPDFDRYLQAFPELAAHKMDALSSDTKIGPGQALQGMVMVAFPMSKDAFDHRQWLHVKVEPYDHLPFTITK
jgi:preprotein translocase subunit Sec61beta